jgi:hypothetical protein
MRLRLVPFALLLASYATATLANPTLCTKTEAVFFSCVVGGSDKIVSLCGDKRMLSSIAPDSYEPYLAYRFGRVGAIELDFPKKRDGSVDKFKYFRQTSKADMGNYDLNEISFSISHFDYRIFDNALPPNEGETENRYSSGVRVSRKGGKSEELSCTGRPISQLLSLQDYVAPDEDDR